MNTILSFDQNGCFTNSRNGISSSARLALASPSATEDRGEDETTSDSHSACQSIVFVPSAVNAFKRSRFNWKRSARAQRESEEEIIKTCLCSTILNYVFFFVRSFVRSSVCSALTIAKKPRRTVISIDMRGK